MSDPGVALDDLELKKRARRRLVGAAALATFAAVVLPMVMDDAPPPVGRDVEIKIPGQDQVASSPVTAAKPAAVPAAAAPAASANPPSAPTAVPAPVVAPAAAPAAVAAPAVAAPSPVVKEAPKEVAKAEAPKPAPAKPVPAAKPATKEVAKAPAAKESLPDAKRAQAILDGQPANGGNGNHVILIGAFADKANVKNIETKLSQLGIKTYTEALDSPQGKKTRVRAGPFPTREAADKALDKMKRIGVNGIVAPKS